MQTDAPINECSLPSSACSVYQRFSFCNLASVDSNFIFDAVSLCSFLTSSGLRLLRPTVIRWKRWKAQVPTKMGDITSIPVELKRGVQQMPLLQILLLRLLSVNHLCSISAFKLCLNYTSSLYVVFLPLFIRCPPFLMTLKYMISSL